MKTKSITKITLLSIFIMSVITAVTLNSCQKESIKPKLTSSSAKGKSVNAVSYRMVIDEANNIMFSSSNSEKGAIGKGYDTSSCVIRTYDTVNKPYSITYDYGTGCVGNDGNTRAGVAVFTYNSNDVRQVNAAMSVSFQNYVINKQTINGSLSLVNNGPNANNNQVISETGNFVGVSQTESDTAQVNYQIEWLAGEFSSPASNWQFSITGTVHQGSSNGQYATITITSALIRNAKNPGCNFYIQGTEQIEQSGAATIYSDYGNPGGCSGQVTNTQNGVTTLNQQGSN